MLPLAIALPGLRMALVESVGRRTVFLERAIEECGLGERTEIVAERAIYLRERMVNLGLINYVLSKYFLLALFCVVQCACLLGIVFPALGLPGGAEAFGKMLGALVCTSLCAVSLGLLLSTVVASAEAAHRASVERREAWARDGALSPLALFLLQDAEAGVDEDDRDVRGRRAGHHVARILFVAGRIRHDELALVG